ncbi:MAG: hypothetical protein JRI44_11940 [Deltaproteobacteria bacterium]|nr:hypothetical protein [Deltaproteobacteria bacterium]
MEIVLYFSSKEFLSSDIFVFPVIEKDNIENFASLISINEDILRKAQKERFFSGKMGEKLLIPFIRKSKNSKIIFLGVGKKEEITKELLNNLFSNLAEIIKSFGINSLTLFPFSIYKINFNLADTFEIIISSFIEKDCCQLLFIPIDSINVSNLQDAIKNIAAKKIEII